MTNTLRNPQPLPISREELEAALASEQVPWVRTRLLTLRALLGGLSPKVAAALNNVSVASVRRWRERACTAGLSALLVRNHGVRQRNGFVRVQRRETG